MTDANHVNVFNFRLPHVHPENQRVAPFKATLARIRALGGELLPATRETVSFDEIDDEGRYRRIPTGWGGLG
jgi:hypothetical protein